jgi:hypothetical protein
MPPIARRFNPNEIVAPGTNGIIVYGAKTVVDPADATADWPTGWKSIGLITDDGFNVNPGRDTEEKAAFNIRGVVKRIPRAGTFEFTFTAMQSNESVFQLYYGAAPTALSTAGHHRTGIPATSDVTEYKWGIELPTTGGEQIRWIVPVGIVTDTSDFDVSETDLPQYGMTVSAQIATGSTDIAYQLDNLAGVVVGP